MTEPVRVAENEAESREPPPRVVGAGCSFEGTVAFRGEVRIEGTLIGDVSAYGRLWIGPEAVVRGNVEVDELVVAGLLEGDVVARERVELSPGARVRGKVRSPRLALADGAELDGRCETFSASPAAARSA